MMKPSKELEGTSTDGLVRKSTIKETIEQSESIPWTNDGNPFPIKRGWGWSGMFSEHVLTPDLKRPLRR